MNLWDRMSSFVSNKIEEIKLSEQQFIEQLKKASMGINDIFEPSKIVDYEEIKKIKDEYANLRQNAINKNNSLLNLFKLDLKKQVNDFLDNYDNIFSKADMHNANVACKRISQYESVINPVEGRSLDKQQLTAIVKDPHNHLVLAGAGTGKTTTIIGYIKYLLSTNKAKAEEILVLSFTNASATEMSERIKKETGNHFDASTFHKLGMNIIAEADNKKPTIFTDSLTSFIKKTLNELVNDKNYFRKLCSYLIFYSDGDISEFEFDSEEDYKEHLKQNPPTTLKGEKVKSYGELEIANFLLINSINYQYETTYKIETSDKQHSQYKPDFYLPDYDIYIEYFGIDRNNNAPKWYKEKDGLSGSEYYIKSMEWKRKLHKKNNTKLVELFAYEHFDNILLESLSKKLNDLDVKFKPLSNDELFNVAKNEKLNAMIELFSTVINLMKNNDCDFDELIRRNNTLSRPIKLDLLIELIKPIYEKYQKHLSDIKQIDFNDMINKATHYIEINKYHHHYKYVIVDEYQDMAQSRYKLLYAMRKQRDFNLFCVGDDWQSIYRFSGSDIGFILCFDKYWGPTIVDRIETTYRFPQSLIELSGSFVMKNPYQIKKELKSIQNTIGFSCEEIQGFNNKFAIEFMEKSLSNLEKNASIILLGRYTFDIELLKENPSFDYHYDNKNGKVVVDYFKRKDLDISFMTAHGSKGLQADYIYIINNKNYGLGFPSRICDAKILKLLLDNTDNYPFAEERRLFYVALTRAKKKVYLVTIKNNESIFVKEIKEIYGKDMSKEKFTCPKCGGRLIKKQGKYGEFFGCSNYKNGCTYIRKI